MRPLLVFTLALLSACATGPEPVAPDAPSARTGSTSAPTPAVPMPSTPPDGGSAVDRLLAQARDLRQAGDLPGSFARLERALRIAPQRAEVYLELARNHKAAGNGPRAVATAERGLLYCQDPTCSRLEALARE